MKKLSLSFCVLLYASQFCYAFDSFWLEPKSGTAGSRVSVFGSGFNELKGKALISSPDLKNGKKFKCKILSWSDEQIVIELPLSAKKEDSNYDIEVIDKGDKSLYKFESFFVVAKPSLDASSLHFREIEKGSKIYTYISFNGACFGTKKGKVKILDSNGKKVACQIYRWMEGFVECRLPAKFQPGNYTFILENMTGKTQVSFKYEAVDSVSKNLTAVDYRWRSDNNHNHCETPLSLNYFGKTYLFYPREFGTFSLRNDSIEDDFSWEVLIGGSQPVYYGIPFLVNQGVESTAMMIVCTTRGAPSTSGAWCIIMHNPGETLDNNHWTKVCDLENFSPYRGNLGHHWGICPVYDEIQKRLHIFYQDSATHSSEFIIRSASINFNLPIDKLIQWDSTDKKVSPTGGIDGEITAANASYPKTDDENMPAAAVSWRQLTRETYFGLWSLSDFTCSYGILNFVSDSTGAMLKNTFDGRVCLVWRFGSSSNADTGFAFFDLTTRTWTGPEYLRKQRGSDSTGTASTPSMAIRFLPGKDQEGNDIITLDPWFFYMRNMAVYMPPFLWDHKDIIYGINTYSSLGSFSVKKQGEQKPWADMDAEYMRKACPLIGVIDGSPPTCNSVTEDKNTYFSFSETQQTTKSYEFSSKFGPFMSLGNKSFGPYMELKAGWSHFYSETNTYSVEFGLKAIASKIYQDKVWLVYLCPVTICDIVQFKNQRGTEIEFPSLRFSDNSSPSIAYIETDRWWSEEQQKERIWNDISSYSTSWDYDSSTIDQPQISSIPSVDHSAKSSGTGHIYSTTTKNGTYMAGKIQGGIKDTFSLGFEGELNFTWSYSDSKSDKLCVTAQLPDGDISSYNMNILWYQYADEKGIDNFWCPPDVRTDKYFYNRPWFITYTTSNIK